MFSILRPLLFSLDPETSHALTLYALRSTQYLPFLKQIYKVPSKPVHAFGLTFKNPLGLAAGYDKDGVAVRGLAALGFGHIEVGTVTPKPQAGNPRPRVFRLAEDEAAINRMGFPSQGMLKVAGRMSKIAGRKLKVEGKGSVVVGVNLGKNKDTPLEEAARDYVELMKVFAPLADYLTINISSPNTIGLRRLQNREMLENLLGQINLERETWNLKLPILVKISPDLSDEELDDAIGVILDKKMDGIIATNTTLSREGVRSSLKGETGGLSGGPLKGRSEAVLSRVVKLVGGRVPIISVGGIASLEDAKKRLALGASLVQVYTGLIYRGPGLVKEILKNL
ncbi:MAG: quinone-dependent dihydroorotate dehydrogenase [Anaerolineales bacterium]|nr:quinone-dependent dihydroorotate dehydrogenase [Anaerolineales bacterium]HMS01212.1 quinone-dependent dihydroorotate dehydrogenase [Anaerolineales bacterium]HNQ94103.1 quinone-dependent dihydroorotate dehydrogenase [Anaerolineales bacterium]